ncbi:MAG: hypothetical protein KAG61_07050 [Bacteriovoracaceae bacterium]|nr:hypothetical protein [Bacteriovoracaceae bacterium]
MNLIARLATLTCLFLFTVSCGYVGERPLESKEIYENSELIGCDIDTDAFSDMMDRNIDEAISCLEQNFFDFQKGVQHDGSGTIDRSVITTFINRFMPKERDVILSSLDVLFKINMLILKDRPGIIASENIKKISKLLLITNHNAVKINRVIEELDKMKGNYSLDQLKVKRAEFQKSIDSFSGHVSEIINSTMGNEQSIDLKEFIDEIADVLDNNGASIKFNVEDINQLLALKKIIVGGEKTVFTSNEVIRLLNNLPTMSMVVFDAYYAKEEIFKGEIGLFREYGRIIAEFQTIFKHRDQSEVLFKKSDFYEVAEFFADYDIEDNIDQAKANSFVDTFFTIKNHMVSKGNDDVRVSDIDRLAFYSKVALEGIATSRKLDNLTAENSRPIRERRVDAKEILDDAQKEIEVLFLGRNISLPNFDLKNLISDLADSLSNIDDIDIDYELLKLAVPLKKLILGGTRTDFNINQLHTLISKVSDLGLIVFDALTYDKNQYSRDKNRYGFFLDLLSSSKKLIYRFPSDKDEVIFPLDELVLFGDKATDNKYNINKFEETIDVILVKFLKGGPGQLTVQDIKTALNYSLEIFEGLYYNDAAYSINGPLLSINEKINKVYVEKVSKLHVPKISQNSLEYYHREFSTLVEDLTLYRTKEGKQHFGNTFTRTKYGINEANLFRFATKKLLAGYCAGNNPDPESCGVDADELYSFLVDFRPLLEEYKLWSEEIKLFTNNCLYLADLFQTVSNGDTKIDLKEGTEYFALITSAVKMGDDILAGLKKRCINQTTGTAQEQADDPTFLMPCFRENVLDIWMNEYGYGQYLSTFDQYLKSAPKKEVMNLIVYLEQFVKDEPNSPIMNKRWITLFAGAILNIEAMIIRFDYNKNNILDPNEVDNAYFVYKGLIIEMGGLTDSTAKYAKSAFKFMVKEMRFPGQIDVLAYHYNPFASKRITARRINIASILNYFATMEVEENR